MFAALLLLVTTLPPLQEAEGPVPVAEKILQEREYQTELPWTRPFTSPEDDESENVGRPPRRSPRQRPSDGPDWTPPPRTRTTPDSSGSLTGGVVKAFSYLLLAVLIVYVLVVVARAVRDLRRRSPEEKVVEGQPARGEPVLTRVVLDGAEALAREGRFAEAIRLLLLRTIEALRARAVLQVEPWWTSREVLRTCRLPERGRSSLELLVQEVESSLFGGRPVDRAKWETCVERYEELTANVGEGAR